MTNYDRRDTRARLESEFDSLPIEHESPTDEPASTVISVRLRPDELALVEHAARTAGLPLSRFIRSAALSAAHPVDLRTISARAEAIASEAGELVTMLRAGAA